MKVKLFKVLFSYKYCDSRQMIMKKMIACVCVCVIASKLTEELRFVSWFYLNPKFTVLIKDQALYDFLYCLSVQPLQGCTTVHKIQPWERQLIRTETQEDLNLSHCETLLSLISGFYSFRTMCARFLSLKS